MLCRQRPAHVHEIAEGQAHAGHGAGEVVNFADRRIRPRAFAKVEVLDPLSLPGQYQQGGGSAPGGQPDDGQQEHQTGKGPGEIVQRILARRGGEHLGGHQEGEIKRRLFPEGGEVDQPLLTLNRCQGQLGGVMQQGRPRSHLLLQPGENGVIEGRQHGQAAQLLEAWKALGIRGQQGPDLVKQHQLAVTGQGQLADEGRESLHARIEPDHRPAIVALHRQCHAWLPGSEEEVGVGHYDARAPARLLVPAPISRIETVVRHGAPLQQPQPLVEIEELSLSLMQALDQQAALGRRRLQRPSRPFGQLANQKEIAVLVTGIDGAVTGTVGQYFRQLGQEGEPRLEVCHGGQLAAAQQIQGHAGRSLVQLDGEGKLLPVLLEALTFVLQPLLHALLELQHDEGAPQQGEKQDEKGGNVYVKGSATETCVCHGRILVPWRSPYWSPNSVLAG